MLQFFIGFFVILFPTGLLDFGVFYVYT